MMVFLSTAVMTIVSLQMMQVNIGFGTGNASSSRVTAYDLTLSAFAMVREDILSKIDAGTFDPATYTYTGSISIPDDPSNLGGSATPAGSFTATIPQYNGNTYRIQIVGTSGPSTVQLSDILQIAPSPIIPSFDCSTVENTILAGNIASVSDADLIAYAQNNCMIKTSTVPPTPTPTVSGSATDCSSAAAGPYSGSGTLELRNFTSCPATVSGSYGNIRMTSLTTSTFTFSHNSAQAIELGTLASSLLDAAGTATGKTFRLGSVIGGGGGGTSSLSSGGCVSHVDNGNGTITFTFTNCNNGQLQHSNCPSGNTNISTGGTYSGSVTCDSTNGNLSASFTNGQAALNGTGSGGDSFRGTDGGDILTITGDCVNCTLVGKNGADTIVIGEDGPGKVRIYGDCTSGCSDFPDIIYVKTLIWTSDYGQVFGGGGNDAMYFQASNGGEFHGENGNDLIACTGSFGQACGIIDKAAYIYGNAGNDILSIDSFITDISEVRGHAGANIIYAKGVNTNGIIVANASSANGGLPSLVVISGDSGSGEIKANVGVAGSVLLRKTGTTTRAFAV